MFVKTRSTPELPATVLDITKKLDGKIAIRTLATERLKNLLAVNKGGAYALEFDKLITDLVAEASELKDYDGESGGGWLFAVRDSHFPPLETSYTNIHSWDVRGVGVNLMDRFLHN